MAFSTFRGFFGSANSSAPPPSLTDIYSQELMTFVNLYSQNSIGNFAGGASTFSGGNFAVAYTTSYNSGQAYMDLLQGGTTNKSYSSFGGINGGTPLALGATNGRSQIVMDVYPNGATPNYLALYETSSSAATGVYVSYSGGTYAVSTTLASTLSLTGLTGIIVKAVIGNTLALVVGYTAAGTGGQIRIWNYVGSSIVTTTSLSGSQINIKNQTLRMCVVSSAIAFACYTDNTTGTLKVVEIDYTSSTVTWNTPVDTTTTMYGSGGGDTGAMCFTIDSTTVGVYYFKSANSLGFRTITLTSGGGITLNAEYVFTTSVASIGAYNLFDAVNYSGSNWIGAYIGVDANLYTLQFSVSGNVITFGATAQPINNSWSGSSSYNFSTGQLIPMDSSHVGVLYQNQSVTPGRYSVGNVLDINNSNVTWTRPVFSNNNYNATDAYSGYNNNNSVCWIGGNRFIWFGQNSAMNSPQVWTNDIGANLGTTTVPGYGSQVSPPGSTSTYTSLFCNLSYNYTNGNPRMLYMNNDGNTNIYLSVLNPGLQGNSSVFGTSTTLSPSGVNTGSNSITNVGPDVSLLLYYSNGGATAGYIVGCVVNTSNNLISSTGTVSQIITTAGFSNLGSASNNYQVSVINSSQVLLTYSSFDNTLGTYGVSMVVLTISGTTITMNTPVNLITGLTASPKSMGAVTFSGGTTGVVMYPNNGNTILYVAGFTISGTTITVGTQNTAASYSAASTTILPYGTSYNTPIVAVNSTQALAFTNGSSGGNTSYFLFTYNNINSITVTNTITGAAPISPAGFMPTDNNDDYVGFVSGGIVNMILRS